MTSTAERRALLELALRTACDAAVLVLRAWSTEFRVSYKDATPERRDPVTDADLEANAFIVERLTKETPEIAIVAEESAAATFADFHKRDRVWFVDPLDGTREFVNKSPEFCVMIGLTESGRPTVGVVVCPALGRIVFGAEGIGAFASDPHGKRTDVRVSGCDSLARARLVVSRAHRTKEAEQRLEALGAESFLPVGSAGVKAALVATGDADLYVHVGRAGKRWDVCAPEALVRAAGGEATDLAGRPYDYRSTALDNLDGLLLSNGLLHTATLRGLAPP